MSNLSGWSWFWITLSVLVVMATIYDCFINKSRL